MESLRSSRRMVSLTAVLLSLSLVSPAGPALAQESPESAVDTVLDTIEALEFDRVADLVCEAWREPTRESLDISSGFGDLPGVDAQVFIDALTISVDQREMSLLDQTDDSAVVGLDAIVDVTMDEDVARELVALMLGAMGDEASEENIELFTQMMLSEMQTASALSTELDVVREDGAWRVCSDLSDLLAGSETESEVGLEAAGPGTAGADSLCDLMSLDELNALGPLQYVETDASMAPSCLYAADLATAGHAVGVDVDSFSDFDSLVEMFSDVFSMDEMDVAGHRSMWMSELNTLYVDSGAGVLMVNVFTGGDEALGLEEVPGYAASVAEFVLPRYLDAQD